MVKKNYQPRYEKCWDVSLCCQKGCPMKCSFCDCPGYGFKISYNKETNNFSFVLKAVKDIGDCQSPCNQPGFSAS